MQAYHVTYDDQSWRARLGALHNVNHGPQSAHQYALLGLCAPHDKGHRGIPGSAMRL